MSIERYFSRSTMQWRQPWQLGGRSRSREVAVPRISREKVPRKLEIQKPIMKIKCPLPTKRTSIPRAGSEAGSSSEVKKAKGMFMMGGLEGLEDEDFTDSSDEEEDGEKTKTLAVK